jgi:undecaprenyl-diphosphatase
LPFLHILVLAIVQGITEFLPISSSGHLVLAWKAFDVAGWQVPQESQSERLILDVAVHLGTLFAVLIYFRRDVAAMLVGTARALTGRRSQGADLAYYLVLATIPLVVVGLLMKDFVTANLRDETVVASTTVLFGVLLYAGDRIGMTVRRIEHLALGSVMVVGFAQVLALIPGTSRSGITMTAARFCGFERTDAARFSMLLAIPAILGAATLAGWDLYQLGNLRLGLDAAMAAAMALVAALVAIAVLMNWLSHATFTPFVVYRIVLGGVLFYLIYHEPVHGWFGP